MDSDFQPKYLSVVLPIPPISLHPMQTISKSGVSKKKGFSAIVHSSNASIVEPSYFKVANSIFEWQLTIKEEIEALNVQNTWSLVPLHSGKNLVGCQWVYRVKRNPYGSVARHKARLVAKGYSQEKELITVRLSIMWLDIP